jgi:hypothetical protein
LHYNPKHTLAEQLAWDAQHAPENVGLSHNVEARTSRQQGGTLVEAILKVQSVDLVADPATTRSLYENVTAETGAATSLALATATLESLQIVRPDLVEAVRAAAAAELATLREEVDRFRAEAETLRRRDTALELFREFQLPDPSRTAGDDCLLANRQFLESVLAAGDDAGMRRLVEERAQLIAAARTRQSHGERALRPLSREQHESNPSSPALDGASFARAIS